MSSGMVVTRRVPEVEPSRIRTRVLIQLVVAALDRVAADEGNPNVLIGRLVHDTVEGPSSLASSSVSSPAFVLIETKGSLSLMMIRCEPLVRDTRTSLPDC